MGALPVVGPPKSRTAGGQGQLGDQPPANTLETTPVQGTRKLSSPPALSLGASAQAPGGAAGSSFTLGASMMGGQPTSMMGMPGLAMAPGMAMPPGMYPPPMAMSMTAMSAMNGHGQAMGNGNGAAGAKKMNGPKQQGRPGSSSKTRNSCWVE